MIEIRTVRATDLDALYRIALLTGDGGADASALYRDPKMVGHIYAAPYAKLCPETVFVAEDESGVSGYIVGPADTPTFEARLETEWWPALRAVYLHPSNMPLAEWTPDQRRAHTIHHPRATPAEITNAYPSHLHINLLPRLRGRGIARRLMDRWVGAAHVMGSCGAHLVVGVTNIRAIRFYEAYGFRAMSDVRHAANGAIWMGLKFGGEPVA